MWRGWEEGDRLLLSQAVSEACTLLVSVPTGPLLTQAKFYVGLFSLCSPELARKQESLTVHFFGTIHAVTVDILPLSGLFGDRLPPPPPPPPDSRD